MITESVQIDAGNYGKHTVERLWIRARVNPTEKCGVQSRLSAIAHENSYPQNGSL
jgi:hypothetical protein